MLWAIDNDYEPVNSYGYWSLMGPVIFLCYPLKVPIRRFSNLEQHGVAAHSTNFKNSHFKKKRIPSFMMSRIRGTRASSFPITRSSHARPPSHKETENRKTKPARSQIKITSNTRIDFDGGGWLSNKSYKTCHPVREDASPGVTLSCHGTKNIKEFIFLLPCFLPVCLLPP